MCSSSAWNVLPPGPGMAHSFISSRPVLKYPLVREAFPDTHVTFSPLILHVVSLLVLFAV